MDLHQVEEVTISAGTSQSAQELWDVLKKCGFKLDEDVFCVDRSEKRLPPWQSRSIVAVYILNDEKEVYEPEGNWNRIVLKYLLATQPRSGISVFARYASEVSTRLGIPMTFRGRQIDHDELVKELNTCADDLTTQLGEPGSEEVAIVIATAFPGRM